MLLGERKLVRYGWLIHRIRNGANTWMQCNLVVDHKPSLAGNVLYVDLHYFASIPLHRAYHQQRFGNV